MEGHEFFVEVEDEYINDTFNLYGLKALFPKYQEALDLILSSSCPDEEEMKQQSYLELYQEAADLYGLIHARFIISQSGMELMREKYLAGSFGLCPRVMCEKQHVLPVGISEELRTSRVKLYCPKCQAVLLIFGDSALLCTQLLLIRGLMLGFLIKKPKKRSFLKWFMKNSFVLNLKLSSAKVIRMKKN